MNAKWLVLLLAAGCAVDADLDDTEDTGVDESEIIYCPDGDCEPAPSPTAKPDLVASWSSPCHYIYVNYPRPHYEIAVGIKNVGAASSKLHTMRVVFYQWWSEWTSAPKYFQLPALAPGQATSVRLEIPCWNHTAGCEVRVTADYANANAESNESNNGQKWFCPKQ